MVKTRGFMSWNIRMLLDGGLVVQTRFGLLGDYVFLALSCLYAVRPLRILLINLADQ